VLTIGLCFRDTRLMVSEEDGNGEAAVQQEAKREEQTPVEIKIPVVEETREEAKEEPKEEKVEVQIEETPVVEDIAVTEEPTEQPVVTDEPAEEDEVTEEPSEEPTEQPIVEDEVKDVKVTVRLLNTGDIYIGDTVRLEATVVTELEYSLAWQINDGNGWRNVPGETSEIYSFVVNAENAKYQYRAVVIIP